jgi:hypothetical protein
MFDFKIKLANQCHSPGLLLMPRKIDGKQQGEIVLSRSQLGLYSFGMAILTGMWAQLPLSGFSPRKETYVKALINYCAIKEKG